MLLYYTPNLAERVLLPKATYSNDGSSYVVLFFSCLKEANDFWTVLTDSLGYWLCLPAVNYIVLYVACELV